VFVDTDIVLIGERTTVRKRQIRLAITEILKASKPVALSALPLFGVGTSSREFCFDQYSRVEKNPGANPTIGMTVRSFRSLMMRLRSFQRAPSRRYSLLELRIALFSKNRQSRLCEMPQFGISPIYL